MAEILFFSFQSIERTQAPADRSVPYLRWTPKQSRACASRPLGEALASPSPLKTEQGRSGRSPCMALHGAPEHTLAAVVRVRVEEPRRGHGLTAEAEDATESGGEERRDGGEEDGQDHHGGAPTAAVGGGPLDDGRLDGAAGDGRWAGDNRRAGGGRWRGWTLPRDLRTTREGREPAMNTNDEQERRMTINTNMNKLIVDSIWCVGY
jgi:hypothetical protein